ncbi:hypothetical protein N9C52_01145 [Pelagibacterales bacterium]|nr:hypothetical protein [Pelagibacterales bacterium]|tara:strand:- start:1519 stop:2130 length:612 start_codon:yes stop_codon:yes gene_type:complete
MQKFISQTILVILIILSSYSLLSAADKNYKIIKLVNEQVITNYDLEQRLKIYSTLNSVNINNENIEQLAKEMLSLMVDEKLQLEQILSYKISVNEAEIIEYINRAYISNNTTLDDFMLIIENNNLDIDVLKKSIEIKLGWNQLSGNLYYRTSKISDIDLVNVMKDDPSLSKDDAINILLNRQINLRAKKFLRDLRSEANIENR